MTKLMAILNSTPDSFFDKGKYFDLEKAVAHGLALVNEGADILDIGGQSTRPGAGSVSEKEELQRVIPLIKALKPQIYIPISIDTMKPGVAAAAIEAGASFINDITGFRDPEMRAIAASSGAKLCVMHMQGNPDTMQLNPFYAEGVVPHIYRWFENQIELLLNSGVKEMNIILDPGIGFGKTVAHNLEILNNLQKFRELGFPLLIGASRKSFMAKILGKTAEELLPSTIAVSVQLILAKVDIIRVHDVKEHRAVVDFMERASAIVS